MRIHFIGIGGIGVSALAKYYLEKGHKVSGSDLVSSEIIESLKKKGAKVVIGKNVFKKRADLIIYSPAVPIKNHHLSNVMSYPQALGELTKKYFTIAVCGTHGKSTTTAMIALILTKVGLDPTVIVGTKIKEFGDSNCRVGKSKYLVIEADEHFGSFLNYWPKIITLTNIEPDHLDYYKNFKNLKTAFRKFFTHLPSDGILICQKKYCNAFFPIGKNVLQYWERQKEVKKMRKILKVPGEHNVLNALAALTTARALKISDKIIYEALSEYKGSWRRFEEHELKIGNCKLKIINDYAHHPTEIKVTLKAARERYPQKKIWCIFQPHQYQRTFYLFNDFVKAFDLADEIVLCDIYEVIGRENKEISKKVSSEKLAQEIKKRGKIVHYIGDLQKIPQFLKRRVSKNDVVLIMGAGDIYKIMSNF